MYALVQKYGGRSNALSGPHIADARDWLEGIDVPIPEPHEGQVLVKVLCAAVNPADISFIKGEYGRSREEGRPAGFEGCGEVVATGAGAEHLKGQRVAFFADISGAWAEFAVASSANCIPLRDDLSNEDGAGQIVNPITAFLLVQRSDRTGGPFVITAGASELGKYMIGLARKRGVDVIATVRRPEAVAYVLEAGAVEVIDTSGPKATEDLADCVARYQPKVLIDAVADQISVEIFSSMPAGARWIIYGGLSKEPVKIQLTPNFIFLDKHIEGFWRTEWARNASAEEVNQVTDAVQDSFVSGKWRKHISARLRLHEALDELAPALNKKDGKVVVLP